MTNYLTEQDNLADLLRHMPEEDQRQWERYGHLRVEPAFADRVLIAYQAAGLGSGGKPPAPDVLAKLRVISFHADEGEGCSSRLLNETTNEMQLVTAVPAPIFGYPVFISIPPHFALRWDAREYAGEVKRSLMWVFLLKARNKSSFMSRGNIYVETPNVLRKLYPNVEFDEDLST